MAEQMNEIQLLHQERMNTGTAWTRNDSFDKNGYLVIKDIFDASELFHPVPEVRGQYNYYDKNPENFTHNPVENQVEGSTSRYWHPQYRQAHTDIRLRLEKELGRKLYNTYYYDRYYYEGQELVKHADRDACEISVTIHVSTNAKGKDAEWPIWIKTPDTYTDKKKTSVLVPGEERALILNAGDGMVYKGCERPHWRNPWQVKSKKVFGKKVELYYHQIFFHYVLADGQRAHCAWDRAR
tara:strand:+ start:4810 stop:5526 length:717 start_codon:yes stop_codon:yes gene_type:complete